MSTRKNLMPVVKAILKDKEFLAGGIFQKEKQYMEKYDLTENQIADMQAHLYFALNIEEYPNRIRDCYEADSHK